MRTSQKYALAGTIIIMALLLLLLLLVYIHPIVPPEEEVVEIELADAIEDAGGFSTPNPSHVTDPTPPEVLPIPQVTTPPPPADPILTQESEEALAVKKQREEELRKQREEQARLEAERLAAEKAAAEKAAAEKAATDKANALMGAFKGNGSGGTGGKTTGGSGGGDNPVKNGVSGGNGWSAKGRVLKGSIPKPSISEFPEGKVVVSFRIDAAGRVSNPKIANGTTISEKTVRDACLNAARNAAFSEGVDEVEGTITYNFKVN